MMMMVIMVHVCMVMPRRDYNVNFCAVYPGAFHFFCRYLIAMEVELCKLVFQEACIESCINKGPKGHITANTGKAVKIRYLQGNSFCKIREIAISYFRC